MEIVMSELVEVKILSMTMTSKYGDLTSGDILRTDAAYAKHLVEDCHAAEYITHVKNIPLAEVAQPIEKSMAARENPKLHSKK